MAKFPHSGIAKDVEGRTLYEFALALSEIHDPQEALEFVRDLLSPQEAGMFARRIKIAELLLDGRTYQEVQEAMKVSQTTIARVGEWLKRSGSGYRLVVERLKKKRTTGDKHKEPTEWSKLKRKYPLMFWPERILDEIVASADKKQKARLRKAVREMDKKSDLYKKLNKAP